MAHIVTYGGSNRLQMGNEELLRPLPFGNNWQTVRVSLLLAVNGIGALDNAASGVLNAMFMMGFCTGTTGGFRSSTSDYLGVSSGLSIGTGASLNPSKAAVTNMVGTGISLVRKTGSGTPSVLSTQSINISFGCTANLISGEYPPGLFSQCMFEIQKPASNSQPNGPVGTYTFWYTTAATVANSTRHRFIKNLHLTTSWENNLTQAAALTATNAQIGAWPWDTLSIGWNKATPTIELIEVAVLRVL